MIQPNTKRFCVVARRITRQSQTIVTHVYALDAEAARAVGILADAAQWRETFDAPSTTTKVEIVSVEVEDA